MADLSAQLGNSVTPQAIYKYEAGKMLPGSPLLIELSRVLNVPADFFFRPFTVQVSGVEFRKKSKLGARERKVIENYTVDRIERYVQIEDITGSQLRPAFAKHAFMVSSVEDVRVLVERLRPEWIKGDTRIQNVICFLESLGVLVIEIEAINSFDGLSGYADNKPVVVVNKNFSPERKRFTALHELGHLVLSFPEKTSTKDVEKFCHAFASEMLFPSSCFLKDTSALFDGKFSLQDLAKFQREYGISIDALLYKARQFNLISDGRYKNYQRIKNSRPAFKMYAEASRIQDETSDRFERLVYKAVNGDLISASKAASLLDVSIDQIMNNSLYV